MTNLLLSCSPECFKLIIKILITHYVNVMSLHPQEVWLMMFGTDDINFEKLCLDRKDTIECAIALIESLVS